MVVKQRMHHLIASKDFRQFAYAIFVTVLIMFALYTLTINLTFPINMLGIPGAFLAGWYGCKIALWLKEKNGYPTRKDVRQAVCTLQKVMPPPVRKRRIARSP